MAYKRVFCEPLVLSIRVIVLLYFFTGKVRVIIGRVVSAERVGTAGGAAHNTNLVYRPL